MNSIDRRTRQEIGRAARRKGIEAEQAVARFYARNGWPHARRMVQTGWHVGDKINRDRGDIDGTPGLVTQVRTSTSDMTGATLAAAMDDTTRQTIAAGADYGLLVVRRAGKADPANWWAWLTIGDLVSLVATAHGPGINTTHRDLQAPVRLQLGDTVPLLHAAGYGSPAIPFEASC